MCDRGAACGSCRTPGLGRALACRQLEMQATSRGIQRYLLREECIDEELGRPVREGERRVAAPDRLRALDRAAHVGIGAVDVLAPHHEIQRANDGALVTLIRGAIKQLGPHDGELAIAGIEHSGKHTVVGRAFNNNEDCSNHSELVAKFGIVNECYLCVSKWDSVTFRGGGCEMEKRRAGRAEFEISLST